MKYQKTIVCLANSRKTAGRCIAGKEIMQRRIGQWIRPVSDRPSREVSEEERRYEDGSGPRLLDVLTIPMEQPVPQGHQTENHLIDSNYYWAKAGKFPWSDITKLLDSPATLWENGYRSYSGLNNRVPESKATGGSLYLIQVAEVTLLVGRKAPEYPDSRRAVRASFNYRGIDYLMDVTDPYIERIYARMTATTLSSRLTYV